jgi:hypothetical protein
MTDNDSIFQPVRKLFMDFRPLWCLANPICIDPMNRDIHFIKVNFRVHQRFPNFEKLAISEFGDTDLTNARKIWIGCFNIDDHKVHFLFPNFWEVLSWEAVCPRLLSILIWGARAELSAAWGAEHF